MDSCDRIGRSKNCGVYYSVGSECGCLWESHNHILINCAFYTSHQRILTITIICSDVFLCPIEARRRSQCQGNLYSKLGFTYSHVSESNYVYFYIKNMEIIQRSTVLKQNGRFRVRNLILKKNPSERDNMIQMVLGFIMILETSL